MRILGREPPQRMAHIWNIHSTTHPQNAYAWTYRWQSAGCPPQTAATRTNQAKFWHFFKTKFKRLTDTNAKFFKIFRNAQHLCNKFFPKSILGRSAPTGWVFHSLTKAKFSKIFRNAQHLYSKLKIFQNPLWEFWDAAPRPPQAEFSTHSLRQNCPKFLEMRSISTAN